MEYSELQKLKKNLINEKDKVLLTNSLQKYNFFIDNYNTFYNTINNVTLKRIKYENIYGIVYIIQHNLVLMILLLIVIPVSFLIIALNIEAFSKVFIVIFDIYFFTMNVVFFIAFIIYFYGFLIAKSNSKKVSNPFLRMVYHPDICNNNIIIKHITIDIEGNYYLT